MWNFGSEVDPIPGFLNLCAQEHRTRPHRPEQKDIPSWPRKGLFLTAAFLMMLKANPIVPLLT